MRMRRNLVASWSLVILSACPGDDGGERSSTSITTSITGTTPTSSTTGDFPTTGVSDSDTDESSEGPEPTSTSASTSSTSGAGQGCAWDQDCDVPENTCATARCDVGSGVCTYDVPDDACAAETCRDVACEIEYDKDEAFVGSTCVYTDRDSGSCDDDDPCTEQDVCSAGACLGTTLACDSPPPPTCAGGNLVESLGPGVCVEGACSYSTEQEACTFGCFAAACLLPNAPLITEVLYDDEGTDDNVWIELWFPPGTNLSTFVLEAVNGSGGAVYDSFALSGTAPADGLVLIVHPTAANAALLAAADFVDAFADLQNGPDSVRLVNGNGVVDALGYGNFGGNVFAGEGNPAPDVQPDRSLARVATFVDTNDNAADFVNEANPTPGALNP